MASGNKRFRQTHRVSSVSSIDDMTDDGMPSADATLSEEDAVAINARYTMLEAAAETQYNAFCREALRQLERRQPTINHVPEIDPDELQEQLERKGHSREKVRQRERELKRRMSKTGVAIAINDFYRLLEEGLSSETLRNEAKFKRILTRTRTLQPLLRHGVLFDNADIAETIFERQQELEGEDEKIKNRFSMMASNFLGHAPIAKHYLNRFAGRQDNYERHLQSVYLALTTTLAQTLPLDANKSLEETLTRMPEYRLKLEKVRGLRKASIRETTMAIAAMVHHAISGNGADADAVENTLFSLTWRVEGLTACIDTIKSQEKETNGRKPSRPFVNRSCQLGTHYSTAVVPACQKDGTAASLQYKEILSTGQLNAAVLAYVGAGRFR